MFSIRQCTCQTPNTKEKQPKLGARAVEYYGYGVKPLDCCEVRHAGYVEDGLFVVYSGRCGTPIVKMCDNMSNQTVRHLSRDIAKTIAKILLSQLLTCMIKYNM